MKAKIRDKQIIVRVNSEESLLILRASVRVGLGISTWLRTVTLAVAREMLKGEEMEQKEGEG